MIGQQCTDRNGEIAGAVQVFSGDDVMLISDQGTMVRTRTSEIGILGRNTQGVRLIRVVEGENLVGIARIEEPDVELELLDEQGEDESPSSETDTDTSEVQDDSNPSDAQ